MYPTRRLAAFGGIVIAALAIGACAPMTVNSVTARGADFRQLRTYAWADDRLETGDPRLDNNPFFLARLQSDVERQLAARGLEKTDRDLATVIVHYHASVTQRIDVGSMDAALTASQKYANENTSYGSAPYVYDEGSLVLDLVDAGTGKLVWRGWAEGSIDGVIDRQERMEEIVDRAVARIFEKFPGL